jgi:hypothetical protein
MSLVPTIFAIKAYFCIERAVSLVPSHVEEILHQSKMRGMPCSSKFKVMLAETALTTP